MTWAYRVTSLGLEFALPALGGYWVDRWTGWGPGGLLVGAVAGFSVGMMHLIQIAREGAPGRPTGRSQ